MAKSQYEYVKMFEEATDAMLLPNAWIVVRIDGRAFHRFTKAHEYDKPNDLKGLQLMDACALAVVQEVPDIVLCFGESDEYSFLFKRDTALWKRRSFKLVSAVVSVFSAHFVLKWTSQFPDQPLLYPPSFDGRAVLYPTNVNVRDYFSWRQADTHINNLYNTCFWTLVLLGNHSNQEAEARLRPTDSSAKNELLFKEFGINYNKVDARFRKGSVIYKLQKEWKVAHVDIIGESFWRENMPELAKPQ